MSAPNLFDIAAANAVAFPVRFEALCRRSAPKQAARLRDFCARVGSDARISINMGTRKLEDFLQDGRHLNPYELARKRAPLAPEEELRARQGEWYEKRVTFDRWFERGEELRYGAVNIGGAGLDYYGKFCVVFDPAVTDLAWQTAFLPGNSLQRYVLGPAGAHRVDEASVRNDAAPTEERHRLAALKHAEHVEGTPEAAWPALLCSGDVFVEAVFLGDATPKEVEEIRIAVETSRRFAELLDGTFSGALAKGEKEEARAFPEILERLEVAGLMDRVKEV